MAAPTITTTCPIPPVQVGKEYSVTLEQTGGSNVKWQVTSGSLPPGLSLNELTGVISGVPTAPGSFNFSVTAVSDDCSPPPEVGFTGETFIEGFDLGLGADTSNIAYLRSQFYVPTDGYDTGKVTYYLEMVGKNLDAAPVTWKVYPITSVGAGGAVTTGLAQTIDFSAGFDGRVRSVSPFSPNSPIGLYLVESPVVTGANQSVCYRMRVVASHSQAEKMVSEIYLTNFFGGSLLDQTIGGGDIFRTSNTGIAGNPLQNWTLVDPHPRWKYEAAAWDTITEIKLWVVMANATLGHPQKWSEFALWDITDNVPVTTAQALDCSLTPRYFEVSFLTDILTDGHVYGVAVRGVKDNAGLFDFSTYVHKCRLRIYLDPANSFEVHSRCGNIAGVIEERVYFAGADTSKYDFLLEVHADVGDDSQLKDYGTSDTDITGAAAPGTTVTVSDAVAKFARVDVGSALTAGNRYAADASDAPLQATLIIKVPKA